MNITIPYGAKGISFDLPDENVWQVIVPFLEKPLDNFIQEMERALSTPLESNTLPEIINSKGHPKDSRVVIICDDATRPAPQKQILDILIPYLQSCGILLSNVHILIATGLHRPLSREEIHERYGNWMAPILIENHSIYESFVSVGQTYRGENICINSSICSADVRISISSVSPHPFSGYSGGSQLILPGIASLESIAGYYRTLSESIPTFSGQYLNTLRSLSDTAAECLNVDFSINLVMNATEEICGVVCGHFKESFLKAANRTYTFSRVRVRPGADVVIAGSYPSENDLWHAFKTFINLASIVKDGGKLLLVSPCSRGMGFHRNLPRYIGMPETSLCNSIETCETIDIPAASVARRVRKELDRIELLIISDCLDEETAELMGIKVFRTIEPAMAYCRESLGESMKATVVPYGDKIIPYFETARDLKDPSRTRWL